MTEQKALNTIVKAICKSGMEEDEKKELLKMAVVLQRLIDKADQAKDYSTKLEQIQQRLGDRIELLENALDKASDILNEGYGEEYASFIYMKNLDERIEIPNNMTISQWKEWLLKDER